MAIQVTDTDSLALVFSRLVCVNLRSLELVFHCTLRCLKAGALTFNAVYLVDFCYELVLSQHLSGYGFLPQGMLTKWAGTNPRLTLVLIRFIAKSAKLYRYNNESLYLAIILPPAGRRGMNTDG